MNRSFRAVAFLLVILSTPLSPISIANSAPISKSQSITVIFPNKSSVAGTTSIQQLIDVAGSVRRDSGESVSLSFAIYKKSSGSTSADARLSLKRVSAITSTVKEILGQVATSSPKVLTFKSATSPNRNKVLVTIKWNLPTPTIASLSPTQGPIQGGTNITIIGTNFVSVQKVTFGGVPATSFVVNSSTRISAVTPARSVGPVDVQVETAGGTASLSKSFIFATPSITGFTPSSGSISGGSTVLISGTNLGGATAVLFGSVEATNFVVTSNGQISATAPAQSAGSVQISIDTPFGRVTSSQSYNYFAPTITSLSPSTGPINGGTVVIITGANLSGASAVTFGGVPAQSFSINSSTQITAVSPIRSQAGSVTVEVALPGSTSVSSTFNYVSSPTINSITPGSGSTSGGLSVLITGTNFIGVTAVTFGGISAKSFTVNSETQISAVTPTRVAGSALVQVTTAGGIATSASAFIYTAPSIESLSPTSGPSSGDTLVTISGTNLLGTTSVTFGGTNAKSFTVVNSTTITAITPEKSAGTVDLKVVTPGGVLTTSFTYIGAPNVTSLNPSSGSTLGGTSVTISGTNFTGVTSVRFGTAPASSFTVVSSTQIVAISPPANPSVVNLTVTSIGGSSARAFTYTAAAASITGVTPSSGSTAGGTVVVITGTNLTGTTAVSFGGTNAQSFSVDSATQITAVAPARVAGNVVLAVVTPGGTVTTSFTYSALPSATTLSPTTGTTSGGTLVTIRGTNFTGATSVKFGGTNAASFTVVNSTTITATTPARVAGPVTVDVITPGGTARASDVFTFEASAPTITSFTPAFGSTAGGTTVVISGTNFVGTSAVSIAGVAARSFTVNSPTQITAVTDDGSGSGTITVTTTGGSSTSANAFSYVAPPSITSLDDVSGPTTGGETIRITGTGFTGTISVTFGGVAAAIVSVTATEITVTTPARAAGAVAVVVTTSVASATKANAYTYE